MAALFALTCACSGASWASRSARIGLGAGEVELRCQPLVQPQLRQPDSLARGRQIGFDCVDLFLCDAQFGIVLNRVGDHGQQQPVAILLRDADPCFGGFDPATDPAEQVDLP